MRRGASSPYGAGAADSLCWEAPQWKRVRAITKPWVAAPPSWGGESSRVIRAGRRIFTGLAASPPLDH
eukprot:4777486-Lingulodinium_polyedra.AAC.1